MPELSDEKYMEQVQNGQFEAMSVLFDRYHEALFRYFLKETFDRALSQDLTQQVFIRAFERRASFSGREGKLKPWLYRIGRNLWLDHLKVFGPKKKVTRELSENYDPPEVHDHNFNEEDFMHLDRCLQLLPEELKEVIILSKYQGMKYAEIAVIIEISESAVKTRVFRAIKMLREIYFDKSINHQL